MLAEKKNIRLSIVLPIDEHEAFRAACRRELGEVRRTSGDGAAAEVLRRFIRLYLQEHQDDGA